MPERRPTTSRTPSGPIAALAGLCAVALPSFVDATPPPDPQLVAIEIVSTEPDDLAAAAAIARASGGEVGGGAGGVLLVRVPADVRNQLADAIGGIVREPVAVDVRPERTFTEQYGPTTGDEVAIVNADAWQAAGIDGSGVRIGVIDFFDTTFWDPDEHGPLPVAGVDALCLDLGTDCTGEFFDGLDEGGEDHGVAVVEVIRDMAPGAQVFIGQATSLSDYVALVDWFADNDVDIISRSLGSRYDGPGDGRGPLDEVAARAVARGMLWVNSGGNNGTDRYYRHQVRLIGDRVAFGPTGTATYLGFTGCVALGGIRWANDWDRAAGDRTDYDAFLWESPTGNPSAGAIVASSTLDQQAGAVPIEHLPGNRCPRNGSSLYLELRWRGGDVTGDVIEILDYGSGIASFTQAPYSASVSVVDSLLPGVVAVGAIDPADSGTIGGFSSQGPTNDGRIAPHVVAPSGFASTVGGWFAGTSAAAAVVSGAAALLVNASLAADPTSLGDLLRHLTIDRGDPGPDQVYGHGELRLPNPPEPGGIDDSTSTFTSLDVPTRILDTRASTATGPPGLIGELHRGEILDLPIAGTAGIPSTGVTAVAVNIVTAAPDRPSYVQALPTLGAAVGGYSNLNVDAPGETRANFAIVPVGADGSISLYSIAAGHLVVDALGWFEVAGPDERAGRFVELDRPERLLDSRSDPPIGPLTSNATRSVPMPTGVDLDRVDALVLTVTAAGATAPGWVQAYPAERSDAIAATSTVNTSTGGTVANTAIVPIGRDGVALTGLFADGGMSHVVVDAIGYITSDAAPPSGAGMYRPVVPNRAFDSRIVGAALGDEQIVAIDASEAAGVTIPTSASAVMWNLAIVGATRPGFMRAWAADGPEPTTSSLNWATAGETRAAAAISSVDVGRIRVRVEDGSADLPGPVGHLIADVFGYFT